MEKIKAIFRIEHDPYMDIDKFIAIFPESKANFRGDVNCLPFWFDGEWRFECHSEICYSYYRETKYIKDKTLLKRLKEIVEDYYNNMPGEKVELIVRQKWL